MDDVPDSRLLERCRALELRVEELERRLVRADHDARLLDATEETALLLDPTGRVLASSEFGARRFGLGPDELVGRCVFDLLPPEAIASRRAFVTQALEAGRPVRRLDERGGLSFETIGYPLQLEGGRAVALYSRDITEHKRAQDALVRNERIAREAQETARIGYYVTDIVTGVWESSPTLDEIFGIDDAWVRTIPNWNGLLHPDDRQGALDHYVDVVSRGAPLRMDYRVIRPSDGELRWVAAYGGFEYGEDGRPVRLLGCIQDITDRKLAEARINAQAALLDLAQDAISVRDLEGRVSYWNKGSERLTGWGAADAVGRRIADLVGLSPADALRAHEALLAKGHWNGELRLRARDGRVVIVTSRWTLVRDEKGAPHSVLAIESDVTEQRSLERQFLRAQRLESIGVLASGVAHDLNNILTPIMMCADALRDSPSAEDLEELVQLIEANAARGAAILKQLLTFGRGVSGERVVVQVGPLVAEMGKVARETFPRNIDLQISTATALSPVIGDATQLHQILLNLCINARDAMPDGGTLAVRAVDVVFDEQYAAMNTEAHAGRYVRLEVADTGVGIEQEDLEKVFDPFFTTKDVGKGSGLGLSTVSGLVRAHGGFIQCNSQRGLGSSFVVFLPAAEGAATPAPPVVRPARGGDGELILVVDDEADIRRALRTTLERQGYRVLCAAEGSDAIAQFTQNAASVRLVLTDVMMPHMDGHALVQTLLRLKPGLKIAVSSGLDEAHRAALRAQGVDVFLAKPYVAADLLAAVRRLLDD